MAIGGHLLRWLMPGVVVMAGAIVLPTCATQADETDGGGGAGGNTPTAVGGTG
ncbi:MAG: hypothetical protein JRI23_20605, partial [Deltaproteobacteria bacterium]|nr:hypothetical protein [Deltaproteobacteria bacterium]MBW2534289.1 hypothetical protein [Deltaproteobacteria bacterium]